MAISDYERIAKAISFLAERVANQPTLDEVASHVHLSPYHFQRLFCRWAGITPKRFLQVLTVEHGKELLARSNSLLDVSGALGLSGSSRLHDHFVQLEAMTPGAYKSRGDNLLIFYGLHDSPFGKLFIAMTERGICRAAFVDGDSPHRELANLQQAWPLASFERDSRRTVAVVDAMFPDALQQQSSRSPMALPLQVSGTNFQIAVWRALLRIPDGAVVSYSRIAEEIGRPASSRAVGNAIGANPVAFLIPCHRVIQQSGALGGYRWGETRKQAIQLWERSRTSEVTAQVLPAASSGGI